MKYNRKFTLLALFAVALSIIGIAAFASIDICNRVGERCSDGSYFIGKSPQDGAKVYMTAKEHETTSQWGSNSCPYCGDGVATSNTDGRVNAEALLAFNPTGFEAAAYCDGLKAHGHSDWYLPAGGTGAGTEQNLFWAMVQVEGTVDGIGSNQASYWSSSEVYLPNMDDSRGAWSQRFISGQQDTSLKKAPFQVRCVRR